MLVVKNESGKILSFNTLSILPGEIKQVPAQYEKNPVLEFFIRKGILKVADGEYNAVLSEEAVAEETAEWKFLRARADKLGVKLDTDLDLEELREAVQEAEDDAIDKRVKAAITEAQKEFADKQEAEKKAAAKSEKKAEVKKESETPPAAQ